jgi:integrase
LSKLSEAMSAQLLPKSANKCARQPGTFVNQSGVDLKTVQKLLGHKNLECTMRYLAKAQSHEVRAKVDAVWNGK